MKNLINHALAAEKKLLLLSLAAILFAACDSNNPEPIVQTYTIDSMTFSYYLSDKDGKIKNIFAQEDRLLFIHLDVTNNRVATMMVDRDLKGGDCYNEKGKWMESMSSYWTSNDSFPTFIPITHGNTSGLVYAFALMDIPSGQYHYQNPRIRYCFQEEIVSVENYPSDIQELMIPLTINFKIQ